MRDEDGGGDFVDLGISENNWENWGFYSREFWLKKKKKIWDFVSRDLGLNSTLSLLSILLIFNLCSSSSILFSRNIP